MILLKSQAAWYAYNGEKIGQGRENAKSFLNEHPEIMSEVEEKVKEKMFSEDDDGKK